MVIIPIVVLGACLVSYYITVYGAIKYCKKKPEDGYKKID